MGSAMTFLRLNSIDLRISNKEAAMLGWDIAEKKITKGEIAARFRVRGRFIDPGRRKRVGR